MRISFVTNFCPHYRIKTFELLAKYIDVEYFFFSEGTEWYWQREHGVHQGDFRSVYLPGFDVGRSRVSPLLPIKLWNGDYDVYIKCIDGRFALLFSFMVARLRKKPFILWTGIWTRLNTIFHVLLFPITHYIYMNADAIVAYGDHVRRYLISEGVDGGKIFVAPHAVDNAAYINAVPLEEKEKIRASLRIEKDQKIVLYLGRLEEAKGLAYLVDAFKLLNKQDAILLIAGDGSFREELENLTRELGVENQVRFTGHIPTGKTTPYYALADVYVLPSISTKRFKEPWGLVVNEAFNQGVPVVVTDAVGSAAGGLVQNDINGFIVKEGDSAALAEAIGKILGDASLRSRLSAKALETISTWDNTHMIKGFVDAVDYVSRKTK